MQERGRERERGRGKEGGRKEERIERMEEGRVEEIDRYVIYPRGEIQDGIGRKE